MKSLGADAAFNYRDPEVARKIREYTEDELTTAFDCIADGASPKICEESISSKGGTISCLLPAEHSRADVVTKVCQIFPC